MEKQRQRKVFIIIALMIAISGLTIGFAAFTSILTISSQASVTPDASTFSVKFSNLKDSLDESEVVPSSKTDGIEATNGVINNKASSPTLTNLSATFTSPGQSVTYTVYARNEGEYTAYLNNINYIGEKKCTPGTDTTASLVDAACNSIKMTVTVAGKEYTATTAISGHALAKKTGEEVKVKLSYEANGALADGEFTVAFGDVTMVYSSIDDSTFVPPATGGGNGTTLTSIMSKNAVSDSSVDFSSKIGLDVENNVAYIRSGTENDTNPIYYYRGNVTKNNVIFANFCWKIVRTTETGGVKLIYNGVTAADGSCNNTGEASQIGTSAFNTNYELIDDVRYIYANGTDSTIKGIIDAWYEANMTSYTSKLEDTPWCNDRSVGDTSGTTTYFGAYTRNFQSPYTPSLECEAEYQMTVASTELDKHLKYPVGLLTADELTLAGNGLNGYSPSSYLYTGQYWWSLSPVIFYSYGIALVFFVDSDASLSDGDASHEDGVRPAISLRPGTEITGTGNGSAATPYIIG